MKWLNRIGMLFEFLSFWFAVPEIVGEERLRALERKVESVLKLTPKAVAVVAVMTAMVVLLLLLAISYTPASYYLSYVYSDVNHLDWLYDSCCCLGLYTIALGNLVGFLAYVVWPRLIALAVNVSSRLLAMLADDQALR